MKYHWIYDERLYPKAKAYPLKLGIIVHRMLHLWQIDKLTKEHINNIVRDITNTYPETEPAEIQSLAFEATTLVRGCLLYTSPSPRDRTRSRMPSSA